MVLTKKEKQNGYSLEWHDRNTRVLTRNGVVVGKVKNQNQLAFEVEAHERYLDVINRNRVEGEKDYSMMTIGQAIIISVFVVAAAGLTLTVIYHYGPWS